MRWAVLSLFVVLTVAAVSRAQQPAPSRAFDAARAFAHLERQVAFGPRPAGSDALVRCRQYIVETMRAGGIAVREQAFEATTPTGRVPMVNVIATIPGRRTDRIALATHYDTKLVREFRFVGASDGASSTAAVLELARALAGSQPEFTIELLFFDGEEAVVEWRDGDHTYGSRQYVAEARRMRTLDRLKALILLDMIGDRDLTVRRDTHSTPWLIDEVWSAAGRLGHGHVFLDEELPIEDDHLPFLDAGVPAIDIIDFDYAAWHTAEDDLPRVSERSLQVVGDVVLAALPQIEKRLLSSSRRIGF